MTTPFSSRARTARHWHHDPACYDDFISGRQLTPIARPSECDGGHVLPENDFIRVAMEKSAMAARADAMVASLARLVAKEPQVLALR